MSPTTILERICRLFASERSEHLGSEHLGSEHLDSINDAFLKGTLNEPVRPMSDQELAHVIREFRAMPVSDWTVAKLSRRFVDVPRDD
ncbi:hypothetical protein IVB14_15680 [Bradyrhizobium sp. 180]|nr:hypothetical protein [Bradyrhizobium sp. CW12]MCK1491826.1 hypothetical protein [Bradyrhizobium sp. 180]MCK1530315.1 hypothetical protein [Bradyrhizobium sp. 182]MCK1596753.1 hypothetical protein [Bradyrhizobium sp. 164]MCK1619819.1 hypothetical protein [Bradyrhizobium sp. 159]MCK1644174.1 hypothetical protein [Bradyrhizobium sp. 154]MCK1664725.1 hypothetical protein [Bradyrhizobium sp. 153]MCK1759960.1 hypothetical protein [Bradyrhizobium sp. 137]